MAEECAVCGNKSVPIDGPELGRVVGHEGKVMECACTVCGALHGVLIGDVSREFVNRMRERDK